VTGQAFSSLNLTQINRFGLDTGGANIVVTYARTVVDPKWRRIPFVIILAKFLNSVKYCTCLWCLCSHR